MKRPSWGVVAIALFGAGGLRADGNKGAREQASTPAPALAVSHSMAPGTLSPDAQNKLVASSCAICHDDEAKTGGLTLEHFDAAKIEENAAVAEKMIRKLRAGMMPPPTVKDRPDQAVLTAFAASLETKIDQAAALHPNPC